MKNRIATELEASMARRLETAEAQRGPQPASDKGIFGRSIEAAVVKHPLICFGAAAAAGIALGWWVKRK